MARATGEYRYKNGRWWRVLDVLGGEGDPTGKQKLQPVNEADVPKQYKEKYADQIAPKQTPQKAPPAGMGLAESALRPPPAGMGAPPPALLTPPGEKGEFIQPPAGARNIAGLAMGDSLQRDKLNQAPTQAEMDKLNKVAARTGIGNVPPENMDQLRAMAGRLGGTLGGQGVGLGVEGQQTFSDRPMGGLSPEQRMSLSTGTMAQQQQPTMEEIRRGQREGYMGDVSARTDWFSEGLRQERPDDWFIGQLEALREEQYGYLQMQSVMLKEYLGAISDTRELLQQSTAMDAATLDQIEQYQRQEIELAQQELDLRKQITAQYSDLQAGEADYRQSQLDLARAGLDYQEKILGIAEQRATREGTYADEQLAAARESLDLQRDQLDFAKQIQADENQYRQSMLTLAQSQTEYQNQLMDLSRQNLISQDEYRDSQVQLAQNAQAKMFEYMDRPPSELTQAIGEVGMMQAERMQRALGGELPVSEATRQARAKEEQLLKETYSRKLGGEYETSTPYIQAKSEFDKRWALIEDQERRGEISTLQTGLLSTAQQLYGQEETEFQRAAQVGQTALSPMEIGHRAGTTQYTGGAPVLGYEPGQQGVYDYQTTEAPEIRDITTPSQQRTILSSMYGYDQAMGGYGQLQQGAQATYAPFGQAYDLSVQLDAARKGASIAGSSAMWQGIGTLGGAILGGGIGETLGKGVGKIFGL